MASSDDNIISATRQNPDLWQDFKLDSSTQRKEFDLEQEQVVSEPEEVQDFENSNDPANPLNWSKKRKWIILVLVSMMSAIKYAAFFRRASFSDCPQYHSYTYMHSCCPSDIGRLP